MQGIMCILFKKHFFSEIINHKIKSKICYVFVSMPRFLQTSQGPFGRNNFSKYVIAQLFITWPHVDLRHLISPNCNQSKQTHTFQTEACAAALLC